MADAPTAIANLPAHLEDKTYGADELTPEEVIKHRRRGKLIALHPTHAEFDILAKYCRGNGVNAAHLPTPEQVVDLLNRMRYTSKYPPLDAALAELVFNFISHENNQSALGSSRKSKAKPEEKAQLKRALSTYILAVGSGASQASRPPTANVAGTNVLVNAAPDFHPPRRPAPRSLDTTAPRVGPAAPHASESTSILASVGKSVGALFGGLGQRSTRATVAQSESSTLRHAPPAASVPNTAPLPAAVTITSNYTGASLALANDDQVILNQLFARLKLNTPDRLSVDRLEACVGKLQAAVTAQEEDLQHATEEWKRLRKG